MKTPYGSYNLTIDGNIAHMRFVGMFNAATTKLLLKEVKIQIEQFGDKPFLILGDLLELEGATPEAYSIINDLNVWINKRNMIAKALLIENKIIAQIARHRIESLKFQNIRYFTNNDEALAWFEQLQKQQVAS
ncbi:hypothetical protein AB6T38_14295 [Aliiglaciecola sp. SL4]|uniref:hypothetical protein n=1 Tax=Aliiglaciecola sp. SL4 TaxID=3239806 RepID=UPI00355AD471